MRIESREDWLQRFAEGGGAAGTPAAPAAEGGPPAGGTADAAAGAPAAADPAAGDAGPGNAAPDTDPAASFAELIRGPYRAQFDAAVQSIVKGQLDRARAARNAAARAQFAGILRQGEALRQKYPGFDLRAELADGSARAMLKAGVPLETVYAFNHRREVAAAAAAVGASRVAAGVAANRDRPPEAGAAGTGAAGAGIDPAKLTRAQREDIRRRVANGERIVLSDYAPK